MGIVDVHAAQADLARLIERACAGEEIVIARDGEPVVRLVPVVVREARKQFGSMKGRVEAGAEFFEALPTEELDAWQQ